VPSANPLSWAIGVAGVLVAWSGAPSVEARNLPPSPQPLEAAGVTPGTESAGDEGALSPLALGDASAAGAATPSSNPGNPASLPAPPVPPPAAGTGNANATTPENGRPDSFPSQGQDPSPVPLPGGGPAADLAPAPAAAAASPPPLLLDITADQQGFDLVINRYVATGNVSAQMAGGRLMADRLEYDTVSRTVYATGSVRFQRGNQFLQASKLRFNLIEGRGEMEDVYGVLDLTTAAVDLNPEVPPAEPLGPPPSLACPTELPPVPDWHPYPWAATAWAGQTTNAGFGETFVFQGSLRNDYLLGAGLQRRLLQAGPFALELDLNLLGHKAAAENSAGIAAQSFGEITAGIGLRAWLQPWLSLGIVQGVSLNTSLSNFECSTREDCAQFLNYLAFEVEGAFSPQWSVVGRIHHRSGAFGVYSGVREGSNAYLVGLRHRFGNPPARTVNPQAELLPPKGCPNRGAEPPERPRSLSEALEQVAMGGTAPAEPQPPARPPAGTGAGAANGTGTGTNAGTTSADQTTERPSFRALRAQEAERRKAIAALTDQRISDVQVRAGLASERRFGVPGGGNANTDDGDNTNNDFGPARPPQVRQLESNRNPKLVDGTLTRLRFQAARAVLTAEGWRADRASFTNDPFTPAQSWMDADDVLAVQDKNGDTVITSRRNRLILEDRLPINVTSRTRIRKEQEVQNLWVLGVDNEDRDGFYVGRRLKPIGIGQRGTLQLEPQFLLQRAYEGTTSSYPLPGQSAGADPQSQPSTLGDLFGLEARLQAPLFGFDADLNLDISTFEPANFANGTRSWGELVRPLKLPLLGTVKSRIFGAYRFRIWNGTLGEQDVYSAYGTSIEQRGELPPVGNFSNSYFWRLGIGNYQSNEFFENGGESQNFAQLWRGNAFGAINSSLTLWRGKPLPSTPEGALRYSPVPIVPGLTFNTNISASLAYFGDGTRQNVFSLSGGPTLTLGHFSRSFLDYTQLTITGGISLRDGLSPFAFDAAVDLGTVGIGLTQQLVGPLVLNGGIGLNVDASSPNYGEITGSYVELRWQRRSYAFSVYYSPYEGIGGVRVQLNDFGFKGTGVPFVPYQQRMRGQTGDGLF
jgi:hypothetical protein